MSTTTGQTASRFKPATTNPSIAVTCWLGLICGFVVGPIAVTMGGRTPERIGMLSFVAGALLLLACLVLLGVRHEANRVLIAVSRVRAAGAGASAPAPDHVGEPSTTG